MPQTEEEVVVGVALCLTRIEAVIGEADSRWGVIIQNGNHLVVSIATEVSAIALVVADADTKGLRLLIKVVISGGDGSRATRLTSINSDGLWGEGEVSIACRATSQIWGDSDNQRGCLVPVVIQRRRHREGLPLGHLPIGWRVRDSVAGVVIIGNGNAGGSITPQHCQATTPSDIINLDSE